MPSSPANDSNEFMADSMGSMRAGAPSPGLLPVVTSALPISAQMRVRANAPMFSKLISVPSTPCSRSRANSINANSPCTKGSDLSGLVTEEYLTGTPSRRNRSPN